MKILHLILRFPPAMGGAEFLCENICRLLVRRGHDITVYTSDLKQHVDFVRLNQSEINRYQSDLKIVRYKAIKIPKLTYPLLPGVLLKLFNKKFDLIHIWTLYCPGISGFIYSKIKKIPYVISPVLDYNNLKQKLFLRKISSLLLSNAEMVFLLSEYSKKIIEEFRFNYKNIDYLTPSIDIQEIENVKFNYLNKYADRKIVMFAGRLTKGKGIDILLKAIKRVIGKIPDVLLVLCGEDFGYRNEIINFIKNENLNNNILILDKLKRKDLISCYKNADVLVLPSRYEGFGIVLIEAMACKLPVIAMNNSAMSYIVENNKTGYLFRNEDTAELSEKIINCLLGTNKNIIEQAFKYAVENFTNEKVIEKLETNYREIVELRNE